MKLSKTSSKFILWKSKFNYPKNPEVNENGKSVAF